MADESRGGLFRKAVHLNSRLLPHDRKGGV
jgi:hypothetical protein